MRIQTSPVTELFPAAAGAVHGKSSVLAPALCGASWMDQARGYQRHRENQSLGHRSRAGSHLQHHLCSCHTVQGSEPPFTTQTHAWMPAKCLPPGTATQGAVIALNHAEGSGLEHKQQQPLILPACEQEGLHSTPIP